MRTIGWLLVIVVAVALGMGAMWWWMSLQRTPPPDGPTPSLVAPGGEQGFLPPPKQVTDQPISETTEIKPVRPQPRTPDLPTSDDDLPVIDADARPGGGTALLERTGGSATSLPEPGKSVRQARDDPSGKPRLAVIPFRLMGTIPASEKDAGAILANLLLAEVDSNEFELYERARLGELLVEQRIAESDLVARDGLAVRFGKLAGIRYLILGSLSRLGFEYHLSARVVDCQTARVGGRGWASFRSINLAPSKIPELVNLLGLREGISTDERPHPPDVNDLISVVDPGANFNVRIRPLPPKPFYVEGTSIRFVVEADRDCFITLLAVDPAGVITLLLPNKWEKRAFIRRDAAITIPSDAAGFRFPIRPPHGETLVKAVATLQPLRFENVSEKQLEQEQFVQLHGSKAIGVEASGNQDGLPAVPGLEHVLPPTQWASDELIVITRGTASPVEPIGDSQSRTEPIHFRVAPRTDDPNEKILALWNDLTSSHLSPPADLLRPVRKGSGQDTPSELLVFYKPGSTASGSAPVGGEIRGWSTHMRVAKLGTAGAKSARFGELRQRVKALKADPDVLAVVPNFRLETYGLPLTKLIPVQWALKNQFIPGNDIGYDRIVDRLRQIRDLPLIGLVDTGLNHDDPRLGHAVWTNSGEVPDNGIDDDANGHVDDVHGWNFLEDSNRLYDPASKFDHGTFVASVIVARPIGEEMDVVGISPRAKIITAIALRSTGRGDTGPGTGNLATVLEAIRYVVNHGAKIVNLSFGGRVSAAELAEINQLPFWDALERRGVTLVCAAGNANSNNDTYPVFPASLPRSNILSVMAIDAAARPGRARDARTGRWFAFTNFGRKTVHLAAPGTLILGISRRDDAMLASGTSFAAAHVTAAAALLGGGYHDAGHQAVVRRVLKAAASTAELRNRCTTGGTLKFP